MIINRDRQTDKHIIMIDTIIIIMIVTIIINIIIIFMITDSLSVPLPGSTSLYHFHRHHHHHHHHHHFYQNHYLIKKIFPTIINALRYDHKWWDLFISSPFRYCQYFEISNRLRANEELYGTIYWTVWNNELWDIKKSKLPSYQTINPMGQFVPSLIFITTWLYILSGPSLIMLSPNV